MGANFVNRIADDLDRSDKAEALVTQGLKVRSQPSDKHSKEYGSLVEGGVEGGESSERSSRNKAEPKLKRRGGRHAERQHIIEEWHLALQENGPVISATVNLSAWLETKAMNQSEPLDWLRRRINRELKDAIGYAPPSYWVLGLKGKKTDHIHLHGALATNPTFAPEIKSALQRAAGPSENKWFRDRKQVMLDYDADRGWAKYCYRNVREAKSGWIVGRHMVASQSVKKSATARANASHAYN